MNSYKLLPTLLFLILGSIVFAQTNPETSNLASGDTYRLEVPQSGIYTLTYSYLTNELNIPASILDFNHIRILSSGEGVVPESNDVQRPFDPVVVPAYAIGSDDGSFDPGDRLLFYAPGPDNINVSDEGIIKKRNNPYDFNGYFFVQCGDDIASMEFPEFNIDQEPMQRITAIKQFMHHEQDQVNLQDLNIANHGTGQRWLGEAFSLNRKQDFTEALRPTVALSADHPAYVSLHFAARASSQTRLRLNVNGETALFAMSGTNITDSEHQVAQAAEADRMFEINELNEISLEFLPNSGNDQAWLDYITLNYFSSELNPDVGSMFYIMPESEDSYKVDLAFSGNGNSPQLFNITDFPNYYRVPTTLAGDRIQFSDKGTSAFNRYIAFDAEKNYPTPDFIEKIENQSLKDMEVPHCLVVYANVLEPAVNRWIAHREAYSHINIEKAEVQQIYNEFSGGKVDPGAIRDLTRYLYEKDGSTFEYLLLFGAASFDYRHINKNHPDYNMVPTYQTAESYDPIFGYPTDDFFALIRPGQGGDLVGSLSINVGRLPARDLEEAQVMVNKIIRYESSKASRGDWQNRFVFLADDGDYNLHLKDADNIAEDVREDSSLIIEKIYFDAYKRTNGASGVRFPDATAKLNDAIRRGALVINYLGHGGPYGWSSERVLTNDDVQSWTNSDQLPLFITATCTFGTYDQPALESTGELLINKGAGGAIALFTTSRPVYSSSNRRLTAATFKELFGEDEKGFIPIGKVLTRAKNGNRQDTLRANARKYTLLGDPTMRILLPNYQIITTSFKGNNAQINPDTIGPLERVTVEGYIADRNGLPVEEYNGVLSPTLFDKVDERSTLGQSSRSKVRDYKTQENILWKGKVPVTAGHFEFTMVVPKSINEEIGQGKIQYFATSDQEGFEDAKGAYEKFFIGGIPTDTTMNLNPPIVDLYLENDLFINGEQVGPNTMVYVKLFDSLGINLSNNGLGKEMVAILDGNTSDPIVLNSFYEPNLEDPRGGTIFYPLNKLEPGRHTLKVRAWNILDLMGEAEIEFFVVSSEEDEIFEVMAYPNPFVESVCIRMKSQLPVGEYQGFLEVFNSVGQVIDEVPVGFLLQSSETPCIEWRPRTRLTHLGGSLYYVRIRVEKNQSSEVLHSPVLKLIKI
ncbi:MAG: type IX secretion system sortase PorU [Bacteroidetes bacterium]|jgi:hypothetical protein|nr:type IX secretion system sortase PorU [Bacteroidota bacterium]